MRTDLDYTKTLLKPFLETDRAYITLNTWVEQGVNIESEIEPGKINDKFIHHVSLLVENGLISNRTLETYDLKAIGIQFGVNGHVVLNSTDIRLTHKGIDFAEMLENKEVLNRLKTDFKDMTFDIMFDAGKTIISSFAKKKLQDLGLE